MDTKPGYSEWVPDFFHRAEMKKLVIVPSDDGKQYYQATIIIPRNEVTRDLGDFVGRPLMLAIKSVQVRLPEKPRERETVTAPIVAQTTRPLIVLDEATGEVLESSVEFSAGGRAVRLRGQDLS